MGGAKFDGRNAVPELSARAGMDEGSEIRAGSGARPLRVLLEMRPALEGYAGIPQEARLLYRGLAQLPGVEVEGLLQHSGRLLAKGEPQEPRRRPLSRDAIYKRHANVIVSLSEDVRRPKDGERPADQKPFERRMRVIRQRAALLWLTLRHLLGASSVRLTGFSAQAFQDFTWRTLFARTLPPGDRQALAARRHKVASLPWQALHRAGAAASRWRRVPRYPVLDTKGFDVFVGQTPYPGRVRRGTSMIVRYHDAIPVFMPHVIPEKARHLAFHYRALKANVADGAWFACVSDATKADLLTLFPQAEAQTETIYNMISPAFFAEDSDPALVPAVLRRRLNEQSGWLPRLGTRKTAFYQEHLFGAPFRYLLIVSTIEPRKNHLRLISAWERLRTAGHDDLKLVVVGTLGWDNDEVHGALAHWLESGDAVLAHKMPPSELRLLYRHAAATVCPSLGEGFDYSGVEAMRCGGTVAASDIPVHREVFADGARYFDPYSTASAEAALTGMLAASGEERAALAAAGARVAERYLPEIILPQWEAFLKRVAAGS